MDYTHHFHNKPTGLRIVMMVLGGIVFAMAVALFFGLIVMWLWNWLMPVIFGLGAITYWQAWGLVLLSHILFKSFPHPKHHRPSFVDQHIHGGDWKEHFRQKCYGYHHSQQDNEKATDASQEPNEQ